MAEEEVILYSPPLRKATCAVGIDVEGGGYYHVHGISEDETAEQQMMIMKKIYGSF